MHVEPSFVLYALRFDPGCCLRVHTVLRRPVELVIKKKSGTQCPSLSRPDHASQQTILWLFGGSYALMSACLALCHVSFGERGYRRFGYVPLGVRG
jgi:hypothetical protein